MDSYNIKDDLEISKSLVIELEDGVKKFLEHPISRYWCSFVRKKSKDIERVNKKIKKNIIKQRQDYESDYS